MENIKIKKEEGTESGWSFDDAQVKNYIVDVGGAEYSVTVDKEYWEKLTRGKVEPAELVRKSFEFLLAREPKESILRKFNLRDINKYFPEYEREILW